MVRRPLGNTGLIMSPVGYGAFKIGRNEAIKYERTYDLPDERAAADLLNGILDLGINYIDTAPAYGLSEQRIGAALRPRRREFVLSTKVGEIFEGSRLRFDFSRSALEASIVRSHRNLRADVIDVLFVHSDGRDLEIQRHSDVVPVLQERRAHGDVRFIGFSAKTVDGARAALTWADAIMVEFHSADDSMRPIIADAQAAGVGVVIKKGLGSGRIDPDQAIRFVLGQAGVSSVVIGSLNLEHMRHNVAVARLL